MSKAILVIDMPSCCRECFALDDHYDYPECLITKEQRGYNFNTKIRRMDKCPLKPIPEKLKGDDSTYYQWGEKMMSFHHCCNTWKWCDGDCKKCSVTQTTYTTSSGTKKRKFELRDNKI